MTTRSKLCRFSSNKKPGCKRYQKQTLKPYIADPLIPPASTEIRTRKIPIKGGLIKASHKYRLRKNESIYIILFALKINVFLIMFPFNNVLRDLQSWLNLLQLLTLTSRIYELTEMR